MVVVFFYIYHSLCTHSLPKETKPKYYVSLKLEKQQMSVQQLFLYLPPSHDIPGGGWPVLAPVLPLDFHSLLSVGHQDEGDLTHTHTHTVKPCLVLLTHTHFIYRDLSHHCGQPVLHESPGRCKCILSPRLSLLLHPDKQTVTSNLTTWTRHSVNDWLRLEADDFNTCYMVLWNMYMIYVITFMARQI